MIDLTMYSDDELIEEIINDEGANMILEKYLSYWVFDNLKI